MKGGSSVSPHSALFARDADVPLVALARSRVVIALALPAAIVMTYISRIARASSALRYDAGAVRLVGDRIRIITRGTTFQRTIGAEPLRFLPFSRA